MKELRNNIPTIILILLLIMLGNIKIAGMFIIVLSVFYLGYYLGKKENNLKEK
jgi:hypothetical protein